MSDSGTDTEMEPRPDFPVKNIPPPPTPPAQVPAQNPPPPPLPLQPDFLFRVPERERGQAPVPSKYTSLRTRQHPTSQEAAIIQNSTATPTSQGSAADLATAFRQSDHATILRLSTENQDLKHQISVLCAQLTNFQSSVSTQLSGLNAKVTSLSQQLARAQSGNTAGAITKTYSSAGSPRTYTVQGQEPPPPPPRNPTLQLSLSKHAEKPSTKKNHPAN